MIGDFNALDHYKRDTVIRGVMILALILFGIVGLVLSFLI